MLVYGDLARLELASDVAASVWKGLSEAAGTAGVDRHAALVRAFIRAGELMQGIADAEFEHRGHDARSLPQDQGAALLLEMAAAVDRSWRSGFSAQLDLAPLLRRLDGLDWDGWIKTKAGEGYAHYGLYPESYLEAARSSRLGPDTRVIGIRSIGTGLAALVATALGAGPAITVRPVGDPFDREIRAARDLIGAAGAVGMRDYAIVDEGPGLSGSSFAAVARWLTAQGVGMNRIHFFPSHAGEPGAAASSDIRTVWRDCPRHPAHADGVLAGADGLRRWVTQRIGPIEGTLEPCPDMPSAPHDSRFAMRKFLARTRTGCWLVRFAGLGEAGLDKLRDARALSQAAFATKNPALAYGFLVQRWVEGVPMTEQGHDRGRFLQTLGRYMAFRARKLGPAGPGASLDDLRRMAVVNTSRALGTEAARRMEARLGGIEALESRVRRVRTDNRLHGWEWLVTGDGFVKIDGVDHCRGHDLVGCQDIAWDVAGGTAEHGLHGDETTALYKALEEDGVVVERRLTAMLLPCYLAFQLGLWSTAQGHATANARLADDYAGKLASLLRTGA